MKKNLSFLLILLVMPCIFLFASQTKYHIMDGAASFIKGEFNNTQVDVQGSILIGPSIKEKLDTKNLLIQSIIEVEDGFYIGTAQSEEIYYYNLKTQKEKIVYSGSKLSISGLAMTAKGLYFAQMPTNNIYFIPLDKLNEKKEVLKPKLVATIKDPSYIWGMVESNGFLYAITGSNAQLYKMKIDTEKLSPEVVWDAKDEKHLISLTKKGSKLYIGAQGEGGLYEFDTLTNKVKMIYKTYEGEVSDIYVDEKEKIYFTTSSKEPKPVGEEFNYTDAFLAQQMEYKVSLSRLLDSRMDPGRAVLLAEGRGETNEPKVSIKNSLYVFDKNKINKLFTLDNSSLNSISKTKSGLILVGSSAGKLISYDEKRNQVSLIGSTAEEEIVSIKSINGITYLATSNLGRLYSLDEKFPNKGEYVSQVFDLGSNSLLGSVMIDAQEKNLGGIKIFIRGGQTQSIDNNWESWDGPFLLEKTTSSKLKGVRYIQYKVEFTGKQNKSPMLNSIKVAFMGINSQPSISLFSVFYDYQNPSIPTYVLNLQWEATDADQDTLFYTIYFKEKGDIQWQMLAELVDQKKLPLDTRLLPDGIYDFKLEVTDKLDNTEGRSSSVKQYVNNVTVDNTPPMIEIKSVNVKNKKITVTGTMKDNEGFILKAYYKLGLDGKWTFINPKGSLYDKAKLEFIIEDTIPINFKDNLENFIFIRAIDSNRNQRVVKQKIE